MPYHFEFDKKHRILLVVVTGEYGDEDQLTINSEIRARAQALDVTAGIGDVSGATAFKVSSAVLIACAREAAPYSKGTPRFLVAPTDLLYGMSRMYQIVGDESRSELQVVRTRREALDALGVTDAVFEPLEEVTPTDRQA